MIRYLLEILVIQCIFLLTYDLFLRRETFFQWNRVYILLVFPFSFVIPLIRIDALTTKIPEENVFFSNFVDLEPMAVASGATMSFWERLSMYEWIYLLGVILMALWFVVKLYRIFNRKQKGSVTYYPHFTKVILPESYLVFSFLKMVFVGDKIAKDKESEILIHELVHVRHWHSLDLLFFELMRIFFWFNPLVFLYQNRMSELHEFIADALATKTTKRAHYSALLAETFQTDKTSFVNPFYKRSLLQKRIAMLTKEKSRGIFKLKYLAVLPLLLGILTYTSCEVTNTSEVETVAIKAGLETTVPFGDIDKVPIFPGCEGVVDQKACFQESVKEHIRKHFNYPLEAKDQGIQGQVAVMFTIDNKGKIVDIRKRGPHYLLEREVERIIQRLPQMQPGQHNGKSVDVPFSIPIVFRLSDENALSAEIEKFGQRGKDWKPFAQLDHAPVFPGCENTFDSKGCFLKKVQEHIRKHFNYPQEARDLGIQGRVAVMFNIDTKGNITDIKKRGPSPLLEAEVERIIASLPRMQPGMYEGKAVNVPFSIPITFKL